MALLFYKKKKGEETHQPDLMKKKNMFSAIFYSSTIFEIAFCSYWIKQLFECLAYIRKQTSLYLLQLDYRYGISQSRKSSSISVPQK